MAKSRGHKFVSEVHLGLLVIILILIGLNFATNYVLYQGRVRIRGNMETRLSGAVLSISRGLTGKRAPVIEPQQRAIYMQEYELTGLFVVPLKSGESPTEAQRQTFLSLVEELPALEVPEVARKLLKSEPHVLTRGEDSEYFFSHDLSLSSGKYLLIVSDYNSSLAYLDDVSDNLMWLGILASAAVLGIYLLLLRYILSPFRRLRREALEAGRPIDNQFDEVESTITDYQRLIAELKESEAKLRELNQALQVRADSLEEYNHYLLDTMEAALVSLDAEGAIVSINQQAEQLFGLNLPQVKGERYSSLIDGSAKLSENIDRCLSEKKNIGYDYYDYQTADRIKTFGVSITFVEPSGQQIKGCSLLISDQTELKRLEKELATSERLSALGEMASGLAHQLRNSMGAMLGFGTLIKKKQEKKETDPKSLADLMAEVKEAEKLIGRFLDFARPLTPILEPVTMALFLDEIITTCRLRADNGRISIELVKATVFELELDPLLMKQAIANLIDNAVIAYGDQGGHVFVSLEPEGEQAIIRVIDQGSGIADDVLKNIFTPFYSTRPSGNGLGLPLAARIVESHGGRIEVDSSPDDGTTFSIYLPLESSRVSNEKEAAAPQGK